MLEELWTSIVGEKKWKGTIYNCFWVTVSPQYLARQNAVQAPYDHNVVIKWVRCDRYERVKGP